ncbi:HAD family phosphatase [Candidatus Acetothermia bacterium]|nr:HAD family phosphatase [Candidatus Acetothermia bacterium]MBI3643370.1 HAD family phosphatase [Candidatus Acetothermia bacterium]
MNQVVIFDLDGLLARTEELHSEAWRATFRQIGIDVSEEEYADHWIRQGKGHLGYLAEKNHPIDPAPLILQKNERFTKLVAERLESMPGALRLLDELKRHHIKLGLASASRRASVELILARFKIDSYFGKVVAFEDAPRQKPYPDPFLLVASHFKVYPNECVVLEDAEKGVLAAFNAGMKCIAIPNELTQNNDFSKATLVLSSLEELTWERIRDL